jgi:hypothetical protein
MDVTFDGKRNTVLSSSTVSADPHLGLEASIKDVFFVRGGSPISNGLFQMAIRLIKRKFGSISQALVPALR